MVCGRNRTRTCDLHLVRVTLYQLSYAPKNLRSKFFSSVFQCICKNQLTNRHTVYILYR